MNTLVLSERMDSHLPASTCLHGLDGEATLRAVIADVLTKRNAYLLGVLDEVLVDEPVVVIPWGAMHLREVGRAVEERGFLCGEPRYVRMITWSTVRRALAKPPSAEEATAPEWSPASR